jgi:hypothetical protein
MELVNWTVNEKWMKRLTLSLADDTGAVSEATRRQHAGDSIALNLAERLGHTRAAEVVHTTKLSGASFDTS